MTIEEIKSRTRPVLSRYETVEAYVFGSAARNQAGLDSDIDLLVKFKRLNGLFDFVKIKLDLEEALGGKSVDLVQMEALRPEMQQRVERERIRIM
jgi:hypothetical protein